VGCCDGDEHPSGGGHRAGRWRSQDLGRHLQPGTAARGKPAYETSCGRCHNNELVGSERALALKGDGFFSHWENDTLDKLFKIRDTMPAGGMESVTDSGKLDILAHVISMNGAPAGREELSIELPALAGDKTSKLDERQ